MSGPLSFIKDHGITFVHFRFVDVFGQWHEISYHVNQVDGDMLSNGIMFDGSSLPGWKQIHDSDMILSPDASTIMMDPFAEHPTCAILCSIIDPKTMEKYDRDPRSTSERAESYLKQTGLADEVRFGPEPEFFIFDEVTYKTQAEDAFYKILSHESESQSGVATGSNTAHYGANKAGYCNVGPKDLHTNIRSEILLQLHDMGIPVEKHHHEVAHSQHELGIRYASITQSADWVMYYKHVVKNIAHLHNKTATFMPKPVADDNGSGMHVHQSLYKAGENLFKGDGYGGLSDMAIYYIGGILKHGKALNAFTNPTINSYRRLVPGFEAPTLALYSARNRSAAVRIPHTPSPKARRIESRFPDPSANPYLAFSALLMAGLDGVQNKIHPGDHIEVNLYDLSESERKSMPSLATSLNEALDALDHDREFLLQGNVFSNEQIDAFLGLKRLEIEEFNKIPTPEDYKLYYGC